jgi:hypothetical protein
MLPIPLELALKVVAYLGLNDQLAFSCVSRIARELVLRLVFHDVQLGRRHAKSFKLQESIEIFNGSSQNMKDSIRYLELVFKIEWSLTFVLDV